MMLIVWLDLLPHGVEEEDARQEEGETEADKEGDHTSQEERGAGVLLGRGSGGRSRDRARSRNRALAGTEPGVGTEPW